MGFVDEIKAWNFSLGLSLLFYIVDFVLGFVNLFHIGSIVVFSVLSLVMGFILMFVEIPFLTRICPTSQKLYGVYIIFSTILFLSGIIKLTSLIVAGFFMTIACLCYVIAALKGQTFTNSSLLGGPGITQM
ncbi:unnamed protein product, partial [Pneumocystis jirovecii]